MRASENEEHISAFFSFYLHSLLVVVTFGCSCLWWEDTWIECVPATIKYSDDETIVEVAQGSEFCLKVEERFLRRRVRHHNLAIVVVHHAVAAVVHYSKRLQAIVCVEIYLLLVPKKDFLDGSHAEVGLLDNIEVRIEAV